MTTIRGCNFPDDRFYHPQHNVWVRPCADDMVVLGATSYGVALAGEFIAFIPKPVGMKIEAGRAAGLLEIAKSVTSFRTPLAGEVAAFNAAAVDDPGLIARDPYGDGWLVQLRTIDWQTAAHGLLSGAAIVSAFEAAMTRDNFTGLLR